MKELLKFILENIVENIEKIEINESEQDNMIIFELNSSDEDKGRIIGRDGRTIKAIRQLLQLKGYKENKKVILKVI